MGTLTLGFPGNALHEASAAAVARVLEAHEHEVALVPLAPDEVAGTIAGGALDLFATAWLPLLDAALPTDRMQPLGLLYRPALIWCVAAAGPASLADLAGCDGLDRRIVVPTSGPIGPAAFRVLEAYGLAGAGYAIDQMSEAEAQAWAGALGWAEADAPTRIVPLCQPHPLLHDGRLRVLDDPLAALGGAQQARLLIRDDTRRGLDPDLIDELDELTLGNKVVSAMAHAMRVQGVSAEAAADAWQRGKLTPRG